MLEYTKKDIKLVCADGYKKYCYPVLAGRMIDYKEQVFIIGIKEKHTMLNLLCFTKKKRVSNPVVGVADPLVNWELA